MRVASAFCFLLLSLLSTVYSRSVPGELKIMSSYDPTKRLSVHQKERVAALRKANKEANSQYKYLERVLADPKKPEHAAAMREAFGNNPDLTAIAENVKLLKKKTLLIKTVEEPFNPNKPGNIAFSRTRKSDGKKHLHFGDRFFNRKTALGQAGTLIHEASHQLFDTKDNFEQTGPGTFHPVSKKETGKSKHPVKSGYLHRDYNADSYKAFGHYAKYGAKTAMIHRY
ncbi:hypothetical protein BDZ97DRAFT_1782744 [Flammula alnicola]|nr:hypothetical protein BDZ97DRAFT_1782744 [Flammula alnicola]